MKLYGDYFYGNQISEYGREHGYLDYATLAKAFDAVLNNDIMFKTMDIGYWEQESGFVDNSDEIEEIESRVYDIDMELSDMIDEGKEDGAEYKALHDEKKELEDRREELEEEQDYQPEVYQWYIVSDNGAQILEEIDEIVYYNEELDIYLWGVTHFGTSWDYVLTDVPCNCGEAAFDRSEAGT